MSWFDQFAEFVAAYRHLAYVLLFVVAFWESIPVFGIFVPGSTIIVAASILIPLGALELLPVLMTATLGSIAGDCGSFLMGRRYGRSLLSWGPLARRADMVARAEHFFREHGGKGIFVGRFLAPIRGMLPAIAGMAGISWSRFLPAAILAAVGWAPLHVLPGALIGASLHVAGAVTARLGIFVLLLLAFGYLLVLLTRALLFWGVPAGARAMRGLLIWARAHNNSFGREIVALLDPAHREAKAIAPLAFLLILGGWGFFAILEDIIAGEALSRADASIFNGLQALRTPWGDMVMVAITELGDAKVTVPVFLAGVGWLLWRRAWVDGAYLAAAVVIAQAVAAAIKIALHTPRPIPELYQGWSAFSFPSGHATVNAVLYGFLTVMAIRETGPILRRFIAASVVLLVGLIALSRLYLGAHWFTDVAGGLGFGIAWVALLGIAYVRHRPPGGLSRGLMPVVTAVLLAAGSVNIGISHSRDLARYQPAPRGTVISAEQWITEDWAKLPSYRIDLGGEYEEPFVLQLAGEPDYLRQTLMQAGWSEPAPWNAIGAVAWLATGGGIELLPVVPKLHQGRLPALMLTMREEGDRTRLVLRLWDSGFRLESAKGETTLWVATVTREDLHQPLHMVSLVITEKDANGPRDVLARTIPALRRKRTDAPAGDAQWDGLLLLTAGG